LPITIAPTCMVLLQVTWKVLCVNARVRPRLLCQHIKRRQPPRPQLCILMGLRCHQCEALRFRV
jgi:hypothetical protein